jgi:O-antigen/teichoic acid export membrane protein
MSLRANAIANYLGQGWTGLMGLAFIPVYIRLLGPEAWGLIGFVAVLQAWFVLLDMGLTPAIHREFARFQAGANSAPYVRNLLRSFEVIYGSLAAVVVALVWLAAPFLSEHWLNVRQLPLPTVVQAVQIMSVVIASRMVEEVYRGVLLGLQRQVWLNGAQALLATLRAVGAVAVLVWIEPSVRAFFVWQGLVSVLSVAVLAVQVYRGLPGGPARAHFDLGALLSIRKFAGGMAVITLMSAALMQLDKLLVSKLAALDDLGYYLVANTVAGAIYLMAAPITLAVAPRMIELIARSEHEGLATTYHAASQWLAVVIVPAGLLMAAFSQPLLLAWTADPHTADQVAPLLTVLAVGTLCNCLMSVPYTAQIAHGWTAFPIRVNAVAIAIIIPAILWAVPRFGALGAAWAWLALNAGYVLISVHFMHVRLLPHEKWRWYRDAIFLPLAAGALCVWGFRLGIELPAARLPAVLALGGVLLVLYATVAMSVPVSRALITRKLAGLLR